MCNFKFSRIYVKKRGKNKTDEPSFNNTFDHINRVLFQNKNQHKIIKKCKQLLKSIKYTPDYKDLV